MSHTRNGTNWNCWLAYHSDVVLVMKRPAPKFDLLDNAGFGSPFQREYSA